MNSLNPLNPSLHKVFLFHIVFHRFHTLQFFSTLLLSSTLASHFYVPIEYRASTISAGASQPHTLRNRVPNRQRWR